jgi:hypothetical protein
MSSSIQLSSSSASYAYNEEEKEMVVDSAANINERSFSLLLPANQLTSVQLCNRLVKIYAIKDLEAKEKLKNVALIIPNLNNPERPIRIFLPVYALQNEATKETALDPLFKLENRQLWKEVVTEKDEIININLASLLPSHLSVALSQYPEILKAYQDYRLGQATELTLSEEGIKVLIEFSDFINDRRFAVSFPEIAIFILSRLEEIGDFSISLSFTIEFFNQLISQLTHGDLVLNGQCTEVISALIAKPEVWKMVMTPEQQKMLAETIEKSKKGDKI